MRDLLRTIYSRRRQHLLVLELRGAPLAHPATIDVVFRQGTAQDLAVIARDPAHEITIVSGRRHQELLAADGRLLVGTLGGRIIYRGWSSTRIWRPGAGVEIAMGPAKGVIFRCFTVADQRGRGVYAAALGDHLAMLRRQGVSRVYINVNVENIPSIRAIRKAGFAPLTDYETTSFMGRSRLILPPGLQEAVEVPAAHATTTTPR